MSNVSNHRFLTLSMQKMLLFIFNNGSLFSFKNQEIYEDKQTYNKNIKFLENQNLIKKEIKLIKNEKGNFIFQNTYKITNRGVLLLEIIGLI